MVVFFAFVFFGMALYQHTPPFGSMERSMITVFGFTFGDAMREMLIKFKDEPFAITYTSAICLIFFSSIAQIYVVLFMSQFEEHLEENEILMEKLEEKKRKNRERLLLMDLFDQKTFSI